MTGSDETLLDLALARATVDRSAHERTDPSTVPVALADERTRVLTLRQGRAVVHRQDDCDLRRLHLRAPDRHDADRAPWFLGRREGVAYLAVQADGDADEAPPTGTEWCGLRDVGADLDDTDAGLLTTATALAGWHRGHRHCPRCGAPTDVVLGGWVRRCPADGSEHYPRTDPAVIMAVVDDADRILLGTGVAWQEGRVSVLAGFVEAGETMEAAVAREVLEEVGVEVTDLVFRGDQPWPYPGSLMLGFRARAVSTALTLDPEELTFAAWFARDDLAEGVAAGRLTLPSRASIARRLIEEWFGGRIPEPGRGGGPEGSAR